MHPGAHPNRIRLHLNIGVQVRVQRLAAPNLNVQVRVHKIWPEPEPNRTATSLITMMMKTVSVRKKAQIISITMIQRKEADVMEMRTANGGSEVFISNVDSVIRRINEHARMLQFLSFFSAFITIFATLFWIKNEYFNWFGTVTDSPLLPLNEKSMIAITCSLLAKSIKASSYCYTINCTAKTIKPVRAGIAQGRTQKLH